MSTLSGYGASLANLALQAAKAAGDEMLTALEATATTKVPVITTAAVETFMDHVPTSYRTEVQALLSPEILAAQTAVNAGLVDRIHIGVAIAQASLDARITSLQMTLAAAVVEKAAAGTVLAPFVGKSGQAGG